MAKRGVKSFADVLHNIKERVSAENFTEETETQIVKDPYFIPSGNTALDVVLSNGAGWVCGKIYEIYGEEHSGKTTEWILLGIQVQKMGGNVILFNAEGGFEPRLARLHGLNLKRPGFVSFKTRTMEACLDMIEGAAESCRNLSTPTLIVVDSVAGLCPAVNSKKDKAMSKKPRKIGAESQTMRWFFQRGIADTIAGTKVMLVFINQVTSNIGGARFGPQFTTPAGKALKFYASYRIMVAETGQRKNKAGNVIGATKTLKVEKNKFVGKDRELDVPVFYNHGWDDNKGIIYYCRENKLFKYNGKKKGFELVLPSTTVDFCGHLVKGPNSWLSKMRTSKSFKAGMQKVVKMHFLAQYEDDDEWLK